MEQEKIKSAVESILFVSGEPLDINRIAKVLGVKKEEVENILTMLSADYSKGRGVIIVRKENMVEMATNPENSDFVSELVKSEIQENLSPAALEVLSIVAYRGPITRADIEAIRGVNCSFTLRSLLMRSLIERVDNPKDNRGYLYKISFQFLESLGLSDVEKLPDFDNLKKDTRIESVLGQTDVAKEEDALESESDSSEETEK